MTTTDALRQLPANPNITHLKKQAKALKKGVLSGDQEAIERVRTSHPSIEPDGLDAAAFTLRDAQATLAREYGFDGWNQLSTHVGEQMVDQRDLHQWFGVQFNNTTWSVIEDETLGPDTPLMDKERMIYSAYASACHWRNIGTEANAARGEHLISRVAARLGDGDLAVRHARRCLELVETHPDVMEDWDAAFAHEALARALAAVGKLEEATRHMETAKKLTDLVADQEDREIVEAELERGPWFGLEIAVG